MTFNIGTLTAITFFKIIETNNLFLLLKNNSKYEWLNKLQVWIFRIKLEEVWEKIKEEYAESEDSLKVKKIEELKDKYERLRGKYALILLCLEALKNGEDKDILNILKKHGYTIKGDINEGLVLIYKQLSNLKNQIDFVKKELEEYLKVDTDEKTSIYEILVSIVVGLGLSLKVNEITLAEFIYYKKSLKNKIKQNKKK